MAENHKPPPPDHFDHFEWLGKIVSLWSGLELLIDSATWQLANMPEKTGACITANILSIHIKLDCLIALCHHRNAAQKTLDDLTKFKSRLYGTSEKRNRAVHDPWSIDTNPDGSLALSQITITAKGKPQFNDHIVPIEELEATYEEIAVRIDEFIKIKDRLPGRSVT